MAKVRNTHITRDRIKDSVRLALWARSAGRCTLCNVRVLGDRHTFLHSVTAAEMAHVIGATDSDDSPRGQDEDIDDREAEENLLLLCHECHRVIDDEDHIELFPADRLRRLKESHERRIEMSTADGGLTRTAVIRVGSPIRGSMTIASRQQIAKALFSQDFLGLVESQHSGLFNTRLTGSETGRGYWLTAQDQIDELLNRVHQAISDGEVGHISVFAIAPIPVLIYLGYQLDDKVETRIYQLQRDNALGWSWAEGEPVGFAYDDSQGTSDAEDVVLVCSTTAMVDTTRLPEHLRDAPVLTLTPVNAQPSPTLVTTEASLFNFATAWGQMRAAAESRYTSAKRWHIVAAAGNSVSVEIGRSLMRGVQPPCHIYQRPSEAYESVLIVNEPTTRRC